VPPYFLYHFSTRAPSAVRDVDDYFFTLNFPTHFILHIGQADTRHPHDNIMACVHHNWNWIEIKLMALLFRLLLRCTTRFRELEPDGLDMSKLSTKTLLISYRGGEAFFLNRSPLGRPLRHGARVQESFRQTGVYDARSPSVASITGWRTVSGAYGWCGMPAYRSTAFE